MVTPGQPYPEPLALLALDHLFEEIVTVALNTQDDVTRCMFLFLQYTRLMHKSISQLRPAQDDFCQKVFAVCSESGDRAVLPRGTYLHQCYITEKGETDNTDDLIREDACVEFSTFNQRFRLYLRERLWHRVQSQLETLVGMDGRLLRVDSALQLLEPCLSVGMSRDGRCALASCALAHTLDVAWFNRRLSVCLHQIMILDIAHKHCVAYQFPARIRERR